MAPADCQCHDARLKSVKQATLFITVGLMLTFLHISDTHISGDPDYHPPWTPESVAHPNRGTELLLQAIQGLPFAFDFILHTGDVCADPHEEDYRRARELLLQLPGPMYLLPGNHDSGDLMEAALHDGRKLHVLRDARLQINGYLLVALDTAGEEDIHAPTLGDEQIAWFGETLDAARDLPIIAAMHHSPVATGVPWLDEEMRIQNGDQIQRILRAHRDQLTGVFHGHIHQQTDTYQDGVLYVCCPSTWSNLAGDPSVREGIADPLTPGGFNLVMLRDSGAFVRRFNLPRLTR